MTPISRIHHAKHDELPTDLMELISAIAELPERDRVEIDAALRHITASTRRRRRILSLVQDALSQLRVDMKYLMFDLEATRRERDEYREQLEEQA